jgi:CRISPR-associated protein Csm5
MLHIGSELQQLYSFEYVATPKFVYQPNAELLAKALYQRERLSDYLNAIKKRQSILPILEQVLGDDWARAKDTEGRLIFPKNTRSLCWTDHQRIRDFRPMMRNAYGQPYIPGSSIKGAIRTAIAYHLLKHVDQFQVPEKTQRGEIEEQIRAKLEQGHISKYDQGKLDDAIFERSLFSNFKLKDDRSKIKSGSNTDFMRAIKVTDSEPLIERKISLKDGKSRFENLPITSEVLVSSRYRDYRAKYRASIYAEFVRSVQTSFTITLDQELLDQMRHQQGMKIPFHSIADILKICQEFAQDQWDAEHNYWQNIQNNANERARDGSKRSLDFNAIRDLYEAETCPYALRLGWGSNMNGTTIGLLLDEQLRSQIRDTCGIKAPGFEAPKSRRTVLDPKGEIRFVPGWAKFKVLSTSS